MTDTTSERHRKGVLDGVACCLDDDEYWPCKASETARADAEKLRADEAEASVKYHEELTIEANAKLAESCVDAAEAIEEGPLKVAIEQRDTLAKAVKAYHAAALLTRGAIPYRDGTRWESALLAAMREGRAALDAIKENTKP